MLPIIYCSWIAYWLPNDAPWCTYVQPSWIWGAKCTRSCLAEASGTQGSLCLGQPKKGSIDNSHRGAYWLPNDAPWCTYVQPSWIWGAKCTRSCLAEASGTQGSLCLGQPKKGSIDNSHRGTQRTKGTKKAPIHFSLTFGKSILHRKRLFKQQFDKSSKNPKFQYAIISKLRSESNRKYQILPTAA